MKLYLTKTKKIIIRYDDGNEDDDESEEDSEYNSDSDLDCDPKNGAPKHLIDGLKKEVYKGEDGEYSCTICTDILVIHESEVIRCPCNYTFHSECIIDWLLVNNSCPVCRRPVVSINSD
ncbi:hypothetical protein MKX03_014011 [Papaver bracteatum]|nr:hypothetical protein MKX03_014011 [Papaver bracteatum]